MSVLDEVPEAEQAKVMELVTAKINQSRADLVFRKLTLEASEPIDLAQVDAGEPTEWYRKPYLPKRQLVLLAGQEGIGKGLLAIQFTRDVLADGGNVLWMSTEDDAVELRQRLDWSGPPLPGKVMAMDTPLMMADLAAYVEKHEIALVIMDAGRDFIEPPHHGQSASSGEYVRSEMLKLKRLVNRTGISILFIHHTNKAKVDNAGAALESRAMVGGAAAFTQVPRLCLLLEQHDGQLALGIYKSNLVQSGRLTNAHVELLAGGGARFEYDEPFDDLSLTFEEWRKAATVPKMSDDDVDDLVLQALQKLTAPLPGAIALFKNHPDLIAGASKAKVQAAYVRLKAAGLLTGDQKNLRLAGNT